MDAMKKKTKKAAAKNKPKPPKKTTRIEKLEAVVTELNIRVKQLEEQLLHSRPAYAPYYQPDWKEWPIYWGISGKVI